MRLKISDVRIFGLNPWITDFRLQVEVFSFGDVGNFAKVLIMDTIEVTMTPHDLGEER